MEGGQAASTGETNTEQMGQLTVGITPQGAIDAGAQWRVDGGSWRSTGYTETVSVGQRSIEFSDVAGWTKPDNRTVTISEGKTGTATGTYVQQTGSLTVRITPQGAIDAGARWRVDGGPWQRSGFSQTRLPVGQHTVEFSDVAAWANPGYQMVMISNGQTTTSVGNFLKIYTVSASLTGGHGTVNPPSQSVNHGGNASVEMTPEPKFRIASIIDNGVSQTIVNPYVISNVTGNHAVVVTFAENQSPTLPVGFSTDKGGK